MFDEHIHHDHNYAKNTVSKKRSDSRKNKEIMKLKGIIQFKNKKLKKANRKLSHFTKKYQKVLGKLKCCFNDDELERLSRKNFRGFRWSNETIQKSLRLRFACKKTGYNYLIKSGFPLPSLPTLNDRIKNIIFKPGIIEDVFFMLKAKVTTLKEHEKNCILLLDEMAIEQYSDYSKGGDEFTGQVTLPYHSGMATHALAFMVRGLSCRYKKIVAYHFTGNSTRGDVLLEVILKIIYKCFTVGLKVVCVGSDMGSNNQAFWKLLNIGCPRLEEPLTSIPHPLIPTEKLWFIPDVPHVIKNARNALINDQIIVIHEYFVKKYNLPSNTVDLKYVEDMYKIDKSLNLKACPNISERHFHPSQWDKMRVNLAVQLIASKKVASAMHLFIKDEKLPKEAITTAWFIQNLDHWFYLMTDKGCGFSLKNRTKQKEAVDFLKEVMCLVRNMKIQTKNVNPKTSWKPVQRGMMMSTNTVLQIQDYLINKCGFNWFLPGRLTSDAIEIFFSLIRQGNMSPNVQQFTYYLKLITVSQYLDTPKTSNYDRDESPYLISLLGASKKDYAGMKKSDKPSLLAMNGPETDISEMCYTEKAIFADMCGYFIKRLLRQNNCEFCKQILTYPAPCLPIHRLTQLKEYCSDKYSLQYIKEEALEFLEGCEEIFVKNEQKFNACSNVRTGLIELFEKLTFTIRCKRHDIKRSLVTIFAESRIGIYIKNKKISEKGVVKRKLNSHLGSSGGKRRKS